MRTTLAPVAPPYDIAHALETLRAADATLGMFIEQFGDFTLQIAPVSSPYEGLTESIVYQQLSGKAAATIYGRFRALFPNPDLHPLPAEILAMPNETLRSVGLSQAKMKAIQDLAEKTQAGLVPSIETIHEMDDQSIKDALVQVRGIGAWTVEMMLIFNLGRPDIWPIHDLGVRKGYARLYKLADLPSPKALQAEGERFRPYRSVAAWYLWRATEAAIIG